MLDQTRGVRAGDPRRLYYLRFLLGCEMNFHALSVKKALPVKGEAVGPDAIWA